MQPRDKCWTKRKLQTCTGHNTQTLLHNCILEMSEMISEGMVRDGHGWSGMVRVYWVWVRGFLKWTFKLSTWNANGKFFISFPVFSLRNRHVHTPRKSSMWIQACKHLRLRIVIAASYLRHARSNQVEVNSKQVTIDLIWFNDLEIHNNEHIHHGSHRTWWQIFVILHPSFICIASNTRLYLMAWVVKSIRI